MAFANAVAITPTQLTALAANDISSLPVTPDGTNGNKFVANKYTLLRVKNTDAAQITVTVHTNRQIDGLTLPDDTFTVPATTGDVIYTGFTGTFHQNESDEVWIEFSAVANVTVAVYQP